MLEKNKLQGSENDCKKCVSIPELQLDFNSDYQNSDSDPEESNVVYKRQDIEEIVRKVSLNPPINSKIAAMFKVILIGDSSAGKTSLLLKYSEGVFYSTPKATIGIDFKIKNLKIDKKVCKFQIWDTAGQERFRSMSNSYIRNSHGCIAIYDITCKSSFMMLEQQIVDFLNYSGGKILTKNNRF